MRQNKKRLTKKQKAEKAEKLKYSRLIFARREADYPEVKKALEFFHTELKKDITIKERYEDKYRKAMRVFILDLFVANQLDPELYIGYFRGKTAYQSGGRMKRMYLSYDPTMKVVDYLIRHQYIEHHDAQPLPPFRKLPRIRATDKLIKILVEDYQIEIGKLCWKWDETSPTVFLRDHDKENISYEDTPETLQMQENMRLINKNLEKHPVFLYLSDNQYRELFIRMQRSTSRAATDFTRKWVRRIFNNGSWKQGGRFYGGWWQNIPREYRHLIRFDDKDVVECDYSGLHINLIYAREKLSMPEGDVYHIPDPKYPDPPDQDLPEDSPEKIQYKIFRGFLKQLLLAMINSDSKEEAWKSMNVAVHGKLVKRNGKEYWTKPRLKLPKELSGTGQKEIYPLMDALAKRHEKISSFFYEDEGIKLQYLDSQIAEQVMVYFSKMGYAILPMHDSFIIHHGLEQELKDCMNKAFKDMFDTDINVDLKYNSIHERWKEDGTDDPEYLPESCELTISEIMEIESEYSVYHKLLTQFRNYIRE